MIVIQTILFTPIKLSPEKSYRKVALFVSVKHQNRESGTVRFQAYRYLLIEFSCRRS